MAASSAAGAILPTTSTTATTSSPRRTLWRRRRLLGPFYRGLVFLAGATLWSCMVYFQPPQQHPSADLPMDKWHSRALLNTSEDISTTTTTSSTTHRSTTTTNGTGEKCMVPAIEQFPQPMMSQTIRKHGGVIIHILVATYMFTGLALVCDDYFVPALDRISAVLNMPPDVAGATFMAAGSSAPELATAVIGVFVAQDDIGISGVIGSAVFNITLVIAVCALAAKEVFYLNWYSVVRDCGSYLICIAVLLGTISNELVSWPEALLFIILYVFYCVGMAFNSHVEKWANEKLPVPASWRSAQQQQQGGIILDAEGNTTYKTMEGNTNKSNGNTMEMTGTNIPLTPDVAASAEAKQVEDVENPLERPDGSSKFELFKFYIMFPINFAAVYTIPDCRKEAWHNAYVATFLAAITWISLYSYVMVWMITIIGFTLGIPDTVMGLTFIAAGVSVPDALSGIAVVKEGHGDMAVSNAIGSNVFDILVCLGLPWFIETTMVTPGKDVVVHSKGLLYSTFSLFSTIVFLIVVCHINNWRLDRKLGIILLVWYFAFMLFASLYELNVFGEFNPPECDSTY